MGQIGKDTFWCAFCLELNGERLVCSQWRARQVYKNAVRERWEETPLAYQSIKWKTLFANAAKPRLSNWTFWQLVWTQQVKNGQIGATYKAQYTQRGTQGLFGMVLGPYAVSRKRFRPKVQYFSLQKTRDGITFYHLNFGNFPFREMGPLGIRMFLEYVFLRKSEFCKERVLETDLTIRFYCLI